MGVTVFVVCAFLQMCLAQTPPERHSLYYVYTALSKPINAPGIFEFTAMGLLDDRKIDYYNSEDKVKVPEQDWMKRKLPADYWEKGTQSRRSKEQWFKVNVNILMERMNQNESDVHVLMWKHGCVADEMPDGTFKFIKGADQYSYDGKDFLAFDDNSMQWVAPVPEAIPTKQKWDGVPILNQYTKGYLEKECVEWLEKFKGYGGVDLKEQFKQSPPKVFLFAKEDKLQPNNYKLTCMATGFYPKEIKMIITKQGNMVLENKVDDALPNGDGKHQLKLTVTAKKSEINEYGCEVSHVGMDKTIKRDWITDGELCPKDSSSSSFLAGSIAGVVVVLVVLAIAVAVAVKLGIIEFNGGIKFNGWAKGSAGTHANGSVEAPLNGHANGSAGNHANGSVEAPLNGHANGFIPGQG